MFVAQKRESRTFLQEKFGTAITRLPAGYFFAIALFFKRLNNQANTFAPLHGSQRTHASLDFRLAALDDAKPPEAEQKTRKPDKYGNQYGANGRHAKAPGR
jgi:hypothetical protein